jgi:hypothetical protein
MTYFFPDTPRKTRVAKRGAGLAGKSVVYQEQFEVPISNAQVNSDRHQECHTSITRGTARCTNPPFLPSRGPYHEEHAGCDNRDSYSEI